jgi:hypothetical protein
VVVVVCAHFVRTGLVDIPADRVDLVVVVLAVVIAVLLTCPMAIGTAENACRMVHAEAEVEVGVEEAVVAGLLIKERRIAR